jgi:putative transposase
VPRDRNGNFEPKIVPKYGSNTNELEEKILGLYARGVSTRDIQDTLGELYGVDVSASTISKITDKVWELVEAGRICQGRTGHWRQSTPSSSWTPSISN